MYAVIETGGKQYRVAPGDVIRVETIPHATGEVLEFSGILAVGTDEGELLTGSTLENAKIAATVTGQGRGDKIVVFKFKRKKQYRKTIGHRQNYTQLTIGEILV